MKRRPLQKVDAEALLKALTALARAQALYPEGHAAIERAREGVEPLLARWCVGEPLVVGATEGFVVVGETAFLADAPQAKALLKSLEARGVEGMLLHPGAEGQEVGAFLRWLGGGSGEWKGARVTLTEVSLTGSPGARGRRLHDGAVRLLEAASRELEKGEIPSAEGARECVREFSELLGEHPTLVQALVLIKDYDRYTYCHSVNVCLLALGLGQQLGLAGDDLEVLGVGGLFHDIGKTRTPVDLIRKPGRLSMSEFLLVQSHPSHGREILERMPGVPSPVPRLVFEHHMRFDGGGYPRRNGAELHGWTPLITAADVYDAMTSHRPYNPPLSPPEAIQAMSGMRGGLLAPEIFEAFVTLLGRIPVGSLVRLAGGEVAAVVRLGEAGEVAELRIVAGPDGKDLPAREQALRHGDADEIVGWVRPLARRLDVSRLVERR